jgi:hypothetical protein
MTHPTVQPVLVTYCFSHCLLALRIAHMLALCSHARTLNCSHARTLNCSHACTLNCSHARTLNCSHARTLNCSHARTLLTCSHFAHMLALCSHARTLLTCSHFAHMLALCSHARTLNCSHACIREKQLLKEHYGSRRKSRMRLI